MRRIAPWLVALFVSGCTFQGNGALHVVVQLNAKSEVVRCWRLPVGVYAWVADKHYYWDTPLGLRVESPMPSLRGWAPVGQEEELAKQLGITLACCTNGLYLCGQGEPR